MQRLTCVFLIIAIVSCKSKTNSEHTFAKPEKPEYSIYGTWTNGLTSLVIDSNQITIQYHGQCYFFYPASFIDSNTVELLWSRDMDCKFDNQTDEDFGLQNVPEIKKPFAKYTLVDTTLLADYYYPDWVAAYSEGVFDGVFTGKFYKSTD